MIKAKVGHQTYKQLIPEEVIQDECVKTLFTKENERLPKDFLLAYQPWPSPPMVPLVAKSSRGPNVAPLSLLTLITGVCDV